MLQRTVSEEENKAFEKAVGKAYPLKMFPFLLPWAMDEVPDDAYERMRTTVPPGYNLMLRLFRPRFERADRTSLPLRLTRTYSGVVQGPAVGVVLELDELGVRQLVVPGPRGVTLLARVGTTIPSAVWWPTTSAVSPRCRSAISSNCARWRSTTSAPDSPPSKRASSEPGVPLVGDGVDPGQVEGLADQRRR